MSVMLRAISALLSLFAFPLFWNQTSDTKQGLAQELSVRLLVEKRDFAIGEAIPLNIQVSNTGDSPLLIGNYISLATNGTPASRIDFELQDDHGHVISPEVEMIDDTFSAQKHPNPATAFLSSYLLLYPGYSLTAKVVIGASLFKALRKAGHYRLSATYTSNGLFYPPVYNQAGLSEADVKSVPFKVWRGKVSTNEVRFRVRSVTSKPKE